MRITPGASVGRPPRDGVPQASPPGNTPGAKQALQAAAAGAKQVKPAVTRQASTTATPEAKLARQAARAVGRLPQNRNPSHAEIRQMLTDSATRHGIPPEILMAVAFKESSWQQFARDGAVLRGRWSPTDQGIMQINEGAHPAAFPRARTDIRFNIEYGARYLASLYRRYGDWPEAIAAYNYGSARRRRKSGKFFNQFYVDKVLDYTGQFQRLPGALPSDPAPQRRSAKG